MSKAKPMLTLKATGEDRRVGGDEHVPGGELGEQLGTAGTEGDAEDAA